jgi:ABC-type molybdate transport system substrate-binding protein
MVPKGNPANIRSLADLGRPGVRLAMPNPAFEGIARQIKMALTKAGGEALADAVYGAKVKDGSTILTHIHHRQTPLFLMQGVADAGVTWVSEAIFQEQAGNPIAHVSIPDADNATAVYAGAQVAGAAHPQAAKAWLDFIRSPEALRIFEGYGFKDYEKG